MAHIIGNRATVESYLRSAELHFNIEIDRAIDLNRKDREEWEAHVIATRMPHIESLRKQLAEGRYLQA